LAEKFVSDYMGSNIRTLRALYAEIPDNMFYFLCNQTSFRAKEVVTMITSDILSAAEQDHHLLLTDDHFECPLTPTGRKISMRQIEHMAKARQAKQDHALRRELRGQKAREMLARYRRDLVICQIVETGTISENPSVSLLQDSKQEVSCKGPIGPSHFTDTFMDEIGILHPIQENQRHFVEWAVIEDFSFALLAISTRL
jgi:hypothetical protein